MEVDIYKEAHEISVLMKEYYELFALRLDKEDVDPTVDDGIKNLIRGAFKRNKKQIKYNRKKRNREYRMMKKEEKKQAKKTAKAEKKAKKRRKKENKIALKIFKREEKKKSAKPTLFARISRAIFKKKKHHPAETVGVPDCPPGDV